MPHSRNFGVSPLLVIFTLIASVGGVALAAQEKADVQIPGGLALSECAGYEEWPAISVSHPGDDKINLIVGNQIMIDAYRAGIPGNGKPFPDGAKAVKIHWKPMQSKEAPFPVAEPDTLLGFGCMIKDAARFADGGGWGYGQFDYDAATDSFKPNTTVQGNDARCGVACHTIVKAKDFVFTPYPKR